MRNLISIHTPTQGVTSGMFIPFPPIPDFNPHSHAGSDYVQPSSLLLNSYFNPHSHAGSDSAFLCIYNLRSISIHTPTQGVTKALPQQKRQHTYFNPHSHAGSDFTFVLRLHKHIYFNPHSHAGSDDYIVTAVYQRMISIHTPTQGVT